MSTVRTSSSAILLTKRKRPQVSYAELDSQEFHTSQVPSRQTVQEDKASDDTTETDVPDNEEHAEYGSTKSSKAKKSTGTANKRAKVSSSPPQERESPFPFMRLPTELRDYIYELTLTQPGGVVLGSTTKGMRRIVVRCLGTPGWFYSKTAKYRLEHMMGNPKLEAAANAHNHLGPTILGVSKQIHSEAVDFLYKQPLVAQDTNTLFTFLTAVGPQNRVRLSDLVVNIWGSGRGAHFAMNHACLASLAECKNLKSLHMLGRVGDSSSTAKSVAERLYRDGHFFFEAYGSAHGRKDAGVDILQLGKYDFEGSRTTGWTKADSAIEPSTAEKCAKDIRVHLRSLLHSAK